MSERDFYDQMMDKWEAVGYHEPFIDTSVINLGELLRKRKEKQMGRVKDAWMEEQERRRHFDDDEAIWGSPPISEEPPVVESGTNTTTVVESETKNETPLENPDLKVWLKVSPAHYKEIIPGYEYMDLMEHMLGFEGVVAHLKGQIYKYMMRMGKKDNIRLEAGKIAWYAKRLEDVIDRHEKGGFPVYRTPF